VGLKHKLEDSATGLSGGEQRRLCLARLLLQITPEVKYVLLDEPTTSLSSDSVKVFQYAIGQIAAQKCVLLTVSHDPLLRDLHTHEMVFAKGHEEHRSVSLREILPSL